MGFFSSITGAVGRGLSAVGSLICSGVSALCGRIGSTALGSAVSSFVTTLGIGVLFPSMEIVRIIFLVAEVVCGLAETLGLKKEGVDAPDELALKAEKDEQKPEDFESTEAYIRHLQEDIELSREEKEKLSKMSPEERSAYRATGTYLYTKAVNERLGLDDGGLRNPELAGITTELLADLVKLQRILSPSDFVVYSRHLQENGVGMKQFSDYLHNRSEDLSTDEKVQTAIEEAAGELRPDMTRDEFNHLLYALNLED